MKRKALNINQLKHEFQVIPDDYLRTVLGGITFANWYELVKYIAEHGVDDNIANTHWDLNGEGGLNRIDIVQKEGVWGFYATTGSASGPDVANGQPGTISVNVNSTWVPVPSGTINNGAKAYLDALNKVWSLGKGYVMGFKTSSDATYENFWNMTFNTLTGAVVGAVTGGISSTIEGVLGATFGGVVNGYLSDMIPSINTTSDTDKVRNDIVLAALQNQGIADYTPGMTMGGTIRFANVELSPMALTIDMRDLMAAVTNHMRVNGVIDNDGEVNQDLMNDYMGVFNQQIQGSTSMVEIIHKIGGTSTRMDSTTGNNGSGGGGGSGHGIGGGGNLSPVGPNPTEPIFQPEFFFYDQAPLPSNDPEITSNPVQYVYPSGEHIEGGVWVDTDGTKWLLIYCDQITDPSDTSGYGNRSKWAATQMHP